MQNLSWLAYPGPITDHPIEIKILTLTLNLTLEIEIEILTLPYNLTFEIEIEIEFRNLPGPGQ